jgi:BON domain
MPGTSWIQSSWLTLVLGAVLAAPSSAATPDVWITTKTGLALLTTAGISWTGIHVDTVLGQVTLHGTVRSAAEKETAETGAQQIGGVQEGVRNLLEVVALQDERAV